MKSWQLLLTIAAAGTISSPAFAEPAKLHCGLFRRSKIIASIITPQDVDSCLHSLEDMAQWTDYWLKHIRFTDYNDGAVELQNVKYLNVIGTEDDGPIWRDWRISASKQALEARGYTTKSDLSRLQFQPYVDVQEIAKNGKNLNIHDDFGVLVGFISEFAEIAAKELLENSARRKMELSRLEFGSLSAPGLRGLKERIASADMETLRREKALALIESLLAAADRVAAKMGAEKQRFSKNLAKRVLGDTSDKALIDSITQRFGEGKIESEAELRKELEEALALIQKSEAP